jgi:indolepyruvate ferredoxin oxidoreductase, beta subunit
MNLKIIICGVGGQGVLYFAKNLYALAGLTKSKVLGSETHGMSQRGGSVVSHVKIGDYASPMVRRNTADLLFSLKAEETYPNLTFLGRGATVIVNSPDTFRIDGEILEGLARREIRLQTFDAGERARSLGNPAAANLVLLARAVDKGWLPFTPDQLKKAVTAVTAPSRLETGLKAIEAGMARNSPYFQ